jgi:two-component system cell cycle sensor histidine kinase/response regulator CckA
MEPVAMKKKEPHAILFVEDEPLLGELMSDALSDRGFAVYVAPNADDALRHLQSGAEIDVLITDIDLGSGMDGAALAARARELRPSLPVIYASGRCRSLQQIAAVPDSIFMPKPYSIRDVGSTLEQVAGKTRRH